MKLGAGVSACVIMNERYPPVCIRSGRSVPHLKAPLVCMYGKCELLAPSHRTPCVTLTEPTESGTLGLSHGGKEKLLRNVNIIDHIL